MIKSRNKNAIVRLCSVCNKKDNLILKVKFIDEIPTMSNIDSAFCKKCKKKFEDWIRKEHPEVLKHRCQCELVEIFIQEERR